MSLTILRGELLPVYRAYGAPVDDHVKYSFRTVKSYMSEKWKIRVTVA
jgi:hypothetical protein